MDALRYAQLLSSKLCHDLITPVSAIQSGLELAVDSGAIEHSEILQLIQQSSDTTVRRLVFFRTIFGASSASVFSSFEPIEALLRSYCEPIKIDVSISTSWQGDDHTNYPLLGRALLNLSYIFCELAPQGGKYTLTVMQTHFGLQIGITLEGAIFELRHDIRSALLGEIREKDLSPQTIQAHMTHEILKDLELQIQLHESTKSCFRCVLQPEAKSRLYEATLF